MRRRSNQQARSIRGAWFLVILGAILWVWAGGSIVLQYPSSHWPSTEGRVVSQYYREFPYDLKHRVTKAQLELRYAYTVAGVAYESDRYSLWRAIYQDPNDVVLAFAEQHRKGTPITVYYKPGNPKEAVLLTGPDWRGDFAMILGGAFLAFVALLLNLLAARAAKARARAAEKKMEARMG